MKTRSYGMRTSPNPVLVLERSAVTLHVAHDGTPPAPSRHPVSTCAELPTLPAALWHPLDGLQPHPRRTPCHITEG